MARANSWLSASSIRHCRQLVRPNEGGGGSSVGGLTEVAYRVSNLHNSLDQALLLCAALSGVVQVAGSSCLALTLWEPPIQLQGACRSLCWMHGVRRGAWLGLGISCLARVRLKNAIPTYDPKNWGPTCVFFLKGMQ